MFHISGRMSQLASQTQSILANTGLKTDPEADDSFTLVLFRIDPVDNYRYTLAYAGLAEPEPMFTPRLGQKETPSPRGFKQRERILYADNYARAYHVGPFSASTGTHPGVLWVSRRKDASSGEWELVEQETLKGLDAAFASSLEDKRDPEIPLYPSIWNAERIVLDKVRARMRALGPYPRTGEIANAIHSSIEQSLASFLATTSQVRVGVYMFTGESWEIPGGSTEGGYVPGPIRATDREESKVFDNLLNKCISANEHAFDWVHRSGKPVLLRPHSISHIWQKRLRECGVQMPPSGGVCIAPIQYDREDALVSGLLLVSVETQSRSRQRSVF